VNFREHGIELADADGFKSLANLAVHAEKILHAALVGNFVVEFNVNSRYAFHLAFDVVHFVPP
jgi:hypothetical protein